jgi:hypothetical protein
VVLRVQFGVALVITDIDILFIVWRGVRCAEEDMWTEEA